ncbi:MAG: TIGR00341 family protein [Gammaproteobacteria bacterium]|nr:MAG: TIGR00341 family protein [Gammaproteobacteria bacterium]
MRLIEVIADAGHLDTLTGLAEQYGALDCWYSQTVEDQRRSVRMLVDDSKRQTVLDALQNLLSTSDNARIVVLPVEAVLPRPEKEAEAKKSSTNKISTGTTREELYNQIEKGARLDGNYLILVFLSTVVAAIGLLENNVAVIIGAMVIAPLLGPNIALAFAATLGDRDLLQESFKTNMIGLMFALLLSVVIGWLWPVFSPGAEILARTDVGFDGVVLALASGAAAVLSLTSGVASALVGVMVAVALLPPTATLGMVLAAGEFEMAAGAALLLAVNVVCVNLSANMVFLVKGVRPRTWIEKRKARQSAAWIVLFWATALGVLLFAVYVRKLVDA